MSRITSTSSPAPAGPRKETKCNCAGTAAAAAPLSRCSGINELVQLDTVWTPRLLEVLNFDIDTVMNTQYSIFVECANVPSGNFFLWEVLSVEQIFVDIPIFKMETTSSTTHL